MLLSFSSFVCVIFGLAVHLSPSQPTSSAVVPQRSTLNGVYRIDIPASDTLYSVVAGASSNIPFAEQQRFFIDLAVRLTPPDLLAIEREGTRISLASSRAPRMNLTADGAMHNSRAGDGHVVHVRLALDRVGNNERLIFTSSGRTDDNFTVEFESIDGGRRLRVVRRISAEGLDQPVIIRTFYNKISEVARWEVYGESQLATTSGSDRQTTASDLAKTSTASTAPDRVAITTAQSDANTLRDLLSAWIDATNKRRIDAQMKFYAARLVRFYLQHDVSQDFVREEKSRVFASAGLIDIRAAEPEIIFQDNGLRAVMRYRKKYRVENGRQSRSGEVIQELRWQRFGNDWRIVSERDIRVLQGKR